MPTGVYKRTEVMKTGKNPNSWFQKGHKIGMGNKYNLGKKNSWKGDKVGYAGLHSWVKKYLGVPHFCEHCGNRDLKHLQYQWSNISGKYKRIISDWQRLCCKCHKAFDRKLPDKCQKCGGIYFAKGMCKECYSKNRSVKKEHPEAIDLEDNKDVS